MTDPALPPGATRLTPPAVFAHWWAMTEACSGRSGDMSAVAWYVATGSSSISDGRESGLAGYWSAASNRIVLADTADLDGGVIRHEMLHALLRVNGHPRDQFLGRCAGWVPCSTECVADAGPPPQPDPAAVVVGPTALVVTGVVDPAVPSGSVDDGWFTFSVLATNPSSTPVRVALAPASDGGPPVSFSFDAMCLRGILPCGNLGEKFRDDRALDPTVAQFAPGETKRLVVDFRVGPNELNSNLPPGPYAFTGFYNGRGSGPRSTPDTVAIEP